SSAGTDSTAPTNPGTPTATTTPYQVTLSWAASTDAREVLGYLVYRNGATFAFTGATSYIDTTVVSGSTYTYGVAAFDGSGNVSSTVNATATTIPGIAGCMNADTSFTAAGRFRQLPTLTGSFTVQTDITPFVSSANNG